MASSMSLHDLGQDLDRVIGQGLAVEGLVDLLLGLVDRGLPASWQPSHLSLTGRAAAAASTIWARRRALRARDSARWARLQLVVSRRNRRAARRPRDRVEHLHVGRVAVAAVPFIASPTQLSPSASFLAAVTSPCERLPGRPALILPGDDQVIISVDVRRCLTLAVRAGEDVTLSV